jgi:hypothetical protein
MDYNLLMTEVAKLLAGAIIGTIATAIYKDFKQKKNEQKSLFMRLLTAKSFIKMPQSQIIDLNMIPIVFRNIKSVSTAYHDYMEATKEPLVSDAGNNKLNGAYLDLLRVIGNEVGYKHLDNKTLLHRYLPNALFDDHFANQELQKQLLDYLKTGNELHLQLMSNMKSQQHLTVVTPKEQQP